MEINPGPAHSSNISLAKNTIEHLFSAGMEEVVICSGNRNAPFIAVISAQDQARVFHHFSEAAAGYFALGRIKQHGKPVAVVVTSGTAAVQLAPAAVEAAYSKLPLVLLTADRPANYRGTAAPQSINQKDLFSANVRHSFDIDSARDLPTAEQLVEIFQFREPLHLNVCFNEPLIDSEPDTWTPNTTTRVATQDTLPGVESPVLTEFLRKYESPVVVLGRVPEEFQKSVLEFVSEIGAPIYAESLSGLREAKEVSPLLLTSGDALLRKGGFDSVIRIGSVPTLGFWRDLERNPNFDKLPVLSITQDGFSGLGRESAVVDMRSVVLTSPEAPRSGAVDLIQFDNSLKTEIAKLLEKYPRSEAALYHTLSAEIESDALVYLGNSLPIRMWDLIAGREENTRVFEANRGVNGIDGQLSTFFGAAQSSRPNWCILGDLTTLYDLEAPYIVEQLDADLSFRFVIMNNQGGKIFELLPDYQKYFRGKAGNDAFIQPQQVNFERFAGLWNLDFVSSEQVPESTSLPKRVILELLPDNEQSQAFWSDYRRLFRP